MTVVAADRFPVTVEVAGERWREARVVLTLPDGDEPGRIYAWTAPGTPRLDRGWDPAGSLIPSARVDWRVALYPDPDDPDAVAAVLVHPGRGCGCGNRLRSWPLPIEPLRYGRLPVCPTPPPGVAP